MELFLKIIYLMLKILFLSIYELNFRYSLNIQNNYKYYCPHFTEYETEAQRG